MAVYANDDPADIFLTYDQIPLLEAATFTLGCIGIHRMRDPAEALTIVLGMLMVGLLGLLPIEFVSLETENAASGQSGKFVEYNLRRSDDSLIGSD